jgi:CrcB protein
MALGWSFFRISLKLSTMKNLLIVGLGGMLGTMLRYIVTLCFGSTNQPIAIMGINVLGSFVIGMVFAISKNQAWMGNEWKLFLATGICGGFTTFSAFSYDNMQMLQSGKYLMFLLYASGSVALGGIAVWLGFKLFS